MTSEKTVLAEALFGNAIATLDGRLTPEDFTDADRQNIYAAMLRLYRSNRPVEPSVLMSELGKDRKAITALADLGAGAVKSGALDYHIQKIREASDKRKITRVLRQMADSERPASEIAAELAASAGEYTHNPAVNREMFLNAIRFMSTVSERVDWMVEGIIQRGANGIIAGVPKASKSWIALELALSCATGSPFLSHFHVPRPCRVALISREDNPSLTGWRTKALFSGRPWNDINLVETNLIINTRNQSDALFLDNPQDVIALIAELKRHRTELAIFDVFNVLHAKDENDNQEMCEVLAQLKRIQVEAKCSTALVHHFNKNTTGSWTERLRGSSAISGYVEWLIGVTIEDEETKLRKLEFELKAASPPPPFYYQIESQENRCEAFIRQQTVQAKEPKQARFM